MKDEGVYTLYFGKDSKGNSYSTLRLDWDKVRNYEKTIDLDKFGIDVKNIGAVKDFIDNQMKNNSVRSLSFKSKKIDMDLLTSSFNNEKVNYIRADDVLIVSKSYDVIFTNARMYDDFDIVCEAASCSNAHKIEIRGLFGYLKYEIDLSDNIFVIHAPNGFGKTTVLRILNGLFGTGDNYLDIEDAPIKAITVEYINKKDKKEIMTMCNGSNNTYFQYKGYRSMDDTLTPIYKGIENFEFNIVTNNYKDLPNTEYLFNYEEFALYLHHYNHNDFLNTCFSIPYKTDDGFSGPASLLKLIELFNNLVSKFYGGEKEIKLTPIKDGCKEEGLGVIYYKVVDNITIRNKMKPIYKCKKIIDYDDIIDFNLLSSGEKYVIYILSKLIFGGDSFDNTLSTSMVIIDEPELYLHVEWQQLLIDSIKKINDFRQENYLEPWKIIISTHSPYIINSPFVKAGGPEYESEQAE